MSDSKDTTQPLGSNYYLSKSKGNETEPLVKNWADEASRKIIEDLSDRRGIGNELYRIDQDIKDEIIKTMANIIISSTPKPDILVVACNNMTPLVYGTYTEQVNSVSVVHLETDSYEKTELHPLTGTPDEWQASYEGIGVVGFLEDFILKNS